MPIVLSAVRVTGNNNVGTLNVGTTADVGTNLCVNGISDLVGAVTTQSTAMVTGVLTAQNNMCVTGTSGLGGVVTAMDTLSVTGTTDLQDDVTVADAKTMTLTNTTTGDINLGESGGGINAGLNFRLDPNSNLLIGDTGASIEAVRIDTADTDPPKPSMFYCSVGAPAIANNLDKAQLTKNVEFGNTQNAPASPVNLDFASGFQDVLAIRPDSQVAQLIIYVNTIIEWPTSGIRPLFRGEYVVHTASPGFTIISETMTYVGGSPADTLVTSLSFSVGKITIAMRTDNGSGGAPAGDPVYPARVTYNVNGLINIEESMVSQS